MHLLKIKFRHPVPDGLSPKKTKNLSNRQMADNGPDLQVILLITLFFSFF